MITAPPPYRFLPRLFRRARTGAGTLLLLALSATCATAACSHHAASRPHRDELIEVFPGVRVDRPRQVVEVDGIVPIDAHDPRTPLVFLELVACSPDTREHESLVMVPARPSEVHAALLLAGFQPGTTGAWRWNGQSIERTAPTGDAIDVRIAYVDAAGRWIEADAADWVVGASTGRSLRELGGRWVFAGSRWVPIGEGEMYDADGTGTLIGLATFGSETIAFDQVISPEASLEEPEWIADARRVPPAGTRVILRLAPAR